ncbi:glycosyltransferase family 4 protein [Chlorobium sp. N1]|uniref:glycosyltransferase family 4 protein n=1 Tax=Chlorobium sp. N1 TaxID=2491138 RepID=UPI001038857E|nr:glycosyltransferase family 4 protein [Chlorobium sp. N1]TCD48454.1 glycosyltransferase family 4 protein [Chlorobium sp. N1]
MKTTPLRIAQIAPLIERVPPRKYGGTERVVYHLTEGLVERGHRVTLFASGDSMTSATLVAPVREGLRLGRKEHSPLLRTMMMLEDVYGRMAGQFDIIHSHLEYVTFPYAVHAPSPTVLTMHGRLDIGDHAAIMRRYRHLPYVSISDDQRRPVPDINWVGTVYHGYPPSAFDFNEHPDDYFLYLGRFSREKRPDQAIMLAIACGVRLKVAAKIDPVDRDYFEERVRPLLGHPLIEYLGEVDERQKRELLKNARALLNTIDWPEPFGLVMIEALASGTPVIVRACGSSPEIITEGETGFLCRNRMDFIRAVRHIGTISRHRCRREFIERFSADAMVRSYESLYEDIVRRGRFQSALFSERPREPLRRVLGRGVAERR